MKVTLLIERIAERAGGAERVVVNVANQLSRNGYEVEILAFEKTRGRPFYPIDPEVDYRNLGITHLVGKTLFESQTTRLAKFSKRFSKVFGFGHLCWHLTYSAAIKRLDTYLSQNPTDLLISFLPSSFTVAAAVAKKRNLKLILSCHNVPKEDFENLDRWDSNPVDRRKRLKALKTCHAITVILPEFQDWFPDSIRQKIHVVRNFIERPDLKALPIRKRSNTIIAVGRLADVKDHRSLILAWGKIHVDHPDWKVEIYGDGPLKIKLQQLINEKGLTGVVTLKDPVTDILDKYRNAKIFCIPSKFEGFGLVTVEAMSVGTPAVGFANCPGTNRIIENEKTGLLVDSTDQNRVDSLAECLLKLIKDQNEISKMSAKSIEVAESYFVENRICDWFNLVRALTDKGI